MGWLEPSQPALWDPSRCAMLHSERVLSWETAGSTLSTQCGHWSQSNSTVAVLGVAAVMVRRWVCEASCPETSV